MARGSRGARRMGARRIRSERGGADHDLRQRPGAALDPLHAARSRRSGARPAADRGGHFQHGRGGTRRPRARRMLCVWLNHGFTKPERRILTSGCGGGITFEDPSLGIRPLNTDLHIDPGALFPLFTRLNSPDSLYARARGVHTAALSDGEELLVAAEDIGRHNTLDRLQGLCLIGGIETQGRILLATGRVSSEMLRKGARMGCPIIASRNSPTSMSVAMAEAFNITLAGYVRQGSMRVYTHPERLGLADAADWSLAQGRGLAAESPQEASGDHGAGL